MDADVVVIGGGVMGLATAWSLARAGVEAIVLERFEVGGGHGSSHGPSRVFRFLYDDPLYVLMAQRSLPLWRELEEASGTTLLRMTGGIQVDSPDVLLAHRTALESCGATAEELTPDVRRGRFPWLEVGDEAALWVPRIGKIEADATMRVLSRVGVREHVIAEAVQIGDGVAISTSSGVLRARACVVAAGAWANSLLQPIGIALPVQVTREQVLYFHGDTDGMVPFVHGQGCWIYAIPGPQAIKVAEHGTGAVTTAEDRSFDLDEQGAARVRDYVRRALPSIDPEPDAFDTCLYTSTPDGRFVLDELGPVVVVSACSGHGFKFAPLIGEIAARLATGRAPRFDITPFSLRRR